MVCRRRKVALNRFGENEGPEPSDSISRGDEDGKTTVGRRNVETKLLDAPPPPRAPDDNVEYVHVLMLMCSLIFEDPWRSTLLSGTRGRGTSYQLMVTRFQHISPLPLSSLSDTRTLATLRSFRPSSRVL